jgi:peptidoglycan hydrolase-like protein with peptidoglycan-binding domain
MLAPSQPNRGNDEMAILLRGHKGKPVQLLQERLGVGADGIFGGGTEKALKAFQQERGLAVDGIAGPDTFAAMGLYELIVLKRGSKGNVVQMVQEKLGIDADGKYGPGTEKAVRSYQQENDLAADGIAGPKTIGKLGLFEGMNPDAGNPWDQLEASEETLASMKSFFGA